MKTSVCSRIARKVFNGPETLAAVRSGRFGYGGTDLAGSYLETSGVRTLSGDYVSSFLVDLDKMYSNNLNLGTLMMKPKTTSPRFSRGIDDGTVHAELSERGRAYPVAREAHRGAS